MSAKNIRLGNKIVLAVLGILLWLPFLGSSFFYCFRVMAAKPEVPSSEPFDLFKIYLLVISFVFAIWTFAARWFFKSFLVARRRVPASSVWVCILLALLCPLIWIPSQAISIFGLIAFFQSNTVISFAPFWLLSVALLFIHFPWFLLPPKIEEPATPPSLS